MRPSGDPKDLFLCTGSSCRSRMAGEAPAPKPPKGLGFFERYLTLWVVLCILGGIALGKAAPGAAKFFDSMAIHVGQAPVVSIPIAVCLFFMMYPIM